MGKTFISDEVKIEKGKHTLEKMFPSHNFEWRGNLGICPFHKDTNQSMAVYVSSGSAKFRNMTGSILYYCFGCAKSGHLEEAVRVPTNVLLQALVPGVPESKPAETRVYDISWAKPWRKCSVVSDYLKSREITECMADKWQLRSASTPDGMAVLIPDVTIDNKTTRYSLRFLSPSGIKYKSTEGPKHITRVLSFPYKSERLTLVEGVFDAIRVGEEALPIHGKTMTELQLEELKNLYKRLGNRRPRKFTLCLDGGYQERYSMRTLMFKIRKNLPFIFARSVVSVCLLPNGKDPGELGPLIYKYEKEIFPKEEVVL